MVEQPSPVEAQYGTGQPYCVVVGDASGRPMARLLMPDLTVEDVVFRVLPHVRAQISDSGPMWFQLRGPTDDEKKALAAVQRR